MRKLFFFLAFLTVASSAYAVEQSNLSYSDRYILDRGRIDDSRATTGGLLGTFVGFGAGHAVIRQYGKIGWVFTAGEVAGMTSLIIGVEGMYLNAL